MVSALSLFGKGVDRVLPVGLSILSYCALLATSDPKQTVGFDC